MVQHSTNCARGEPNLTRDEPTLIEHLRTLRAEVTEIMADNRAYWAGGERSQTDTQLYERRRERLEEIKEELRVLAQHPAAPGDLVISSALRVRPKS